MLQCAPASVAFNLPRDRCSTLLRDKLYIQSCSNKDELTYNTFLMNLLKPFKGKARGMVKSHPQIISSNRVFEQEYATAWRPSEDDGVEDIALEVWNKLNLSETRGSSEGSLIIEIHSMKVALQKLVRRCLAISQRTKKVVIEPPTSEDSYSYEDKKEVKGHRYRSKAKKKIMAILNRTSSEECAADVSSMS